MSEAELVEALTSYYEIALTAIGMYVSVTSGYLVVAYLAGTNLDKTQVFIISVLFTVVAGIMVYAVHGFMWRAYGYIQSLKSVAQSGVDYYAGPFSHVLLPVILACGIVASLKFMWDVRHPRTG